MIREPEAGSVYALIVRPPCWLPVIPPTGSERLREKKISTLDGQEGQDGNKSDSQKAIREKCTVSEIGWISSSSSNSTVVGLYYFYYSRQRCKEQRDIKQNRSIKKLI